MTEINSISVRGVNLPQSLGTSQAGSADGNGGLLFGDDLIGGTEDTYTSDTVKEQIKTQAQELIKLAKRMNAAGSDGSEGSEGSSALKKSLNTKLKALKEQAEAAGIDLNALFSEISEETNMSRKDQKLISKTLKVKISKKTDASSESSSSAMAQQSNPFGTSSKNPLFAGFAGTSSVAASSVASSAGSPSPTANPTYANTPKVKLDKAFLDKTKEIASRIGCDYKDLLAVMNSESGLSSTARNPHGGATGLIQFMPATAKALGTTTDELARMSPTQQLDYVEKFFNMNKKAYGMEGKKLSGADLYSLIFLPARANREVLTASGENYYAYNRGLDSDKDGKITKSDLQRRIAARYVDESRVFGTA